MLTHCLANGATLAFSTGTQIARRHEMIKTMRWMLAATVLLLASEVAAQPRMLTEPAAPALVEPASSEAPGAVAPAPAMPKPPRRYSTVVATNPVALGLALYGGSITHAFSDHVAPHAAFYYIKGNEPNAGYVVFGGVQLYLDHAFDGWFVEPVLAAIKKASFDNAGEVTKSPGLMGGYHHIFNNGLSLGGSVGVISYKKYDSAPESVILPMFNVEVGCGF